MCVCFGFYRVFHIFTDIMTHSRDQIKVLSRSSFIQNKSNVFKNLMCKRNLTSSKSLNAQNLFYYTTPVFLHDTMVIQALQFKHPGPVTGHLVERNVGNGDVHPTSDEVYPFEHAGVAQ